ncbi:MAG TPA: DUF4442 domain-containing protein [Bacteroidia bacterium]|jgi:hypothetical protein
MAYIAGVRVKNLTDMRSVVTIRHGWLTQNPFRSMYFACQSMAAEMSTGLLVMNGVYESRPGISMLVVKNNAEFFKKAVGRITFICEDGMQISEAISKTRSTGEGVVLLLKSTGRDESGAIVSEFNFTWSLKVKSL